MEALAPLDHVEYQRRRMTWRDYESRLSEFGSGWLTTPERQRRSTPSPRWPLLHQNDTPWVRHASLQRRTESWLVPGLRSPKAGLGGTSMPECQWLPFECGLCPIRLASQTS
jgi:hypothetical protein